MDDVEPVTWVNVSQSHGSFSYKYRACAIGSPVIALHVQVPTGTIRLSASATFMALRRVTRERVPFLITQVRLRLIPGY
jgi:hypothetical protein